MNNGGVAVTVDDSAVREVVDLVSDADGRCPTSRSVSHCDLHHYGADWRRRRPAHRQTIAVLWTRIHRAVLTGAAARRRFRPLDR